MGNPVWMMLLGVILVGCGSREGPSSRGNEASEDTGPRIVCLVPAITQMIVDLDLGDQLVGVGHPDPAAPEAVARMGNYLDVDAEALLTAEPDLVITVASKDSPSARLRRLAKQGGFDLAAYPYPDTVEQVLTILAGSGKGQRSADPSRFVPLGRRLGKSDRARALCQNIQRQLEKLNDQYIDSPRPSVLLVIGTNPVMASGPGTVHSRLLSLINSDNAAAGASVTAPTYDRESLTALQPEVIVMLRPNARPLTDDDPRLAEFRGLPVPAVRQDRIRLINDPKCQLPSTNLPRIAKKLGQAVHGEDNHDHAQ